MKNFYIIDFKTYNDYKGTLIPFEYNINCPFEIKRVFYIYNVPPDIERGKHKNVNTRHVLIALKGECYVDCNDGNIIQTFVLNSSCKGLYINKGVYKKMYNFSDDAVLLCLCSDYFNKNEYV